MSLRHLVLFRFHEGTEPATVEAIAEGLRALPGQIPELVDYRVGADLAINEGNFEFGVTADFASQADYLVYRDHPAHQAAIRDLVAPVLADRAAVQYAT